MNQKIYKCFLHASRVVTILSLFYLPLVVSAQDPNFHIYLLFGQSNMEGMGAIEAQDRVSNTRVKVLQDQTCSNLGRTYGQWYTAAPPLNRCWAGLGPGDWFGKTMADVMPSHVTIGLVATAVGGCDIAFFQKGAPLGKASANGGGNADIPSQFTGGYAWMLDLAQKAKQAGVIKGILFHQGETNTGDPNWKYKVQGIVSDLKKDLGIGDVPFLAGELLYTQYNSCCAIHNTEIAKLPGIIPNSHVIMANNLPGVDVAHFSSASYRELGRRYAQKMLSLTADDCDTTSLVPYTKIGEGSWQASAESSVDLDATVVLGPLPASGGTWSWAGCETSGSNREQVIRATSNCTATATFTNTCGGKSRVQFKIHVKGTKTCCGSKASNGYAYCCTNSDPDGDGWGWEAQASCIVPGSTADIDKCGVVTGYLDKMADQEIYISPTPCREYLAISLPAGLPSLLSISILTMQGVQVYKEDLTSKGGVLTVQTSDLRPDLYMLKISNGQVQVAKKFIKIH